VELVNVVKDCAVVTTLGQTITAQPV
jgi:hypothetical protein